MAEANQRDRKSAIKVPEFLRESLEAAQNRLEVFEVEAQRIFRELKQRGNTSRKELSELVQRLQNQEWHLTELRDRLESVRETGKERAQQWRNRAELFRTDAMERLVEMQAKAVKFLGVATREQVEELSHELEKLSKRLEKGEKARHARRSKKAARSTGSSARN